MERKKVNSSSIRTIGYDERGRVLEVEFNDGRINQYTGVSPEVHRRLMSAPSIVSYFRDNVEESFPAKRIKG
ncbi:MAG TPA: KTSC domain-containing protein [Burkholderiales bacterium]|jgi:YD repeat-containing protein|nr:KTSC domain-containing protein [Burkholderiales bacterium]